MIFISIHIQREDRNIIPTIPERSMKILIYNFVEGMMSKIRIITPSQQQPIPTLKRTSSSSSKRVHFDETVRVMFIPNRMDLSSLPQTIWWDIHDYKQFQTDALLELASFMETHPLIANKRAAYRKMFQSPTDYSCKPLLSPIHDNISPPHDDH